MPMAMLLLSALLKVRFGDTMMWWQLPVFCGEFLQELLASQLMLKDEDMVKFITVFFNCYQ
jgi:hypothetical protein